MATPLSKDTKMVLKLDLGEDGLRRIALAKLWDESRQTVSFNRLVELILEFKKLRPRAVQNEKVTVSATYMDEDGDEITISSDSELHDAFEQFTNSQPPLLRAKAVVVKTKKVGEAMKKVLRQEIKKEQRQILREAKKEQGVADKGNSDELNRVDATATVTPVVRLPHVAPPRTIAETINAPSPASDVSGFDPNFIHGRHTCDACLTTPIFGLRYHAMNLPDYDLCSRCHDNYTGKNVIFKPIELDRDQHLQSRWMRRFRRPFCNKGPQIEISTENHRLPQFASGTQTKKVIEGMDDALKEAIRRSLIDSWPMKKHGKKEEKKEGKVETSAKTEASEEETVEEKDIHVAQVVEIETGNEETQKTIDSMDPKVKEALRNKLNAFFARRAGNKSEPVDEQEKDESSLVPTEETQREIDAMDPQTKEAIRQSLNQFFENRRAAKKEESNTESTDVESDEDVKRTKDILETMDEDTKDVIRRNLNAFFERRSRKNEDSDSSAVDDMNSSGLPSVVFDAVVDHDLSLSVGTDGVDVDTQGSTEMNKEDETDHEIDSGVSDDAASKDEWQMVSEHDEMIAVAAQMLGSALFQSDSSKDNSSDLGDK